MNDFFSKIQSTSNYNLNTQNKVNQTKKEPVTKIIAAIFIEVENLIQVHKKVPIKKLSLQKYSLPWKDNYVKIIIIHMNYETTSSNSIGFL